MNCEAYECQRITTKLQNIPASWRRAGRVLVEELVLRIDVITEEILMAQTLEQCVDLFRTFSNIENFFSWQITCDLLELDVIQLEENS